MDEPVSSTALRFVCIADTHGRLGDIVERIPGGDVLIHAGDMTNFGEKEELNKFNDTIDGEDESRRDLPYRGHGTARGYKLLTNCTYLQDCGVKGERWGCSELLNTIEKRVRPKFHVFGHVHEQNGLTSNGETTFINASICDHQLAPVNNPIIFDIELRAGTSKNSLSFPLAIVQA
ncbi:unnamed protein product [Gongylonema pulchrum]|uniref:Metallophos domain-containing protein n=1 Tax=Gongylonema pulchrum TaxID=637853 RepID=A0A3P7NQQ8_9BILA|nr:unnamed protein product [Gongylonema pulchrum]